MLVANRGEIAVRIINECKQMGIKTVAICSEIERDSLHMQIADEGYCIGAATIKESYTNMEAIINTALITNSDLLHPGYGFLSENVDFVQLCERHNISFIGPTSDTLTKASDKIAVKKNAREWQIPVLTGYTVKKLDDALIHANNIGYPVMIKVSNGGGGTGMQPVYKADELKKSVEMLCSGENRELLIEKYIETARHIEIQIMADMYGKFVTLGNRECSIQLNNKKVLEECPAQNLSDNLLKKLYADSLKLAKAVSYVGLGTVEFLVDEAENYYFMEMNARIQVEHGITEMITGINLMQWQIKIAAGERIAFTQDDITFAGHAIECRINAETCGQINKWCFNYDEARFDHALFSGMNVTPYYDSLLGKLISHDQTKIDAVCKMQRYLDVLQIDGIKTNIEQQKAITNDDRFINMTYYTSFLRSVTIEKKNMK